MVVGDLDTRIDLLEPQYGEERTGQQSAVYVRRLSAWASVDSSNVRDQVRFRQAGLKATARLTIRQTRAVLAIGDDWRALVGGKQHAIELIAHSPDRAWTTLGIYRIDP